MLALLLLLFRVFVIAPSPDATLVPATAPDFFKPFRLVDRVQPGSIREISVALPDTAAGTVADTVEAGEVFITNFPDSINGLRSVRYAGIELPTRSWLRNKTFFWRTTESDRGDHALWFYVFREDAADVPADSVAIQVTIR